MFYSSLRYCGGGVTEADRGPVEPAANAEAPAVVFLVRLEDEAITPVTERFLRRALREAAQGGAQCLVLQLDTPGDTMRMILSPGRRESSARESRRSVSHDAIAPVALIVRWRP